MATSAQQPQHVNRLAKETSPYLLQHQHNPVDWYAWGDEAFEAARRQDKPIFLSVGYSTCYWCHVMERQSFENEQIAAEMNKRFVNIKVDREERPDVDQLYMTAVQVLTRHGGWPMSVFLLPDLRPFYGGTYFPPTDQHGRPGFVTVLTAIEDAYRSRRDQIHGSADQLVNILRQLAEPAPPSQAMTIDDALIRSMVERSTSDYDPTYGGFGSAPKFPRETLLEMLLVHNRHAPDAGRVKMLTHTLDAMAMGGIRDQLGGGFHRYSTDAEWLVPHFEIMLYDNAMLAWSYVEAFAQTEERRFASVARGVFDFVLREMTSPNGAFYTAFDAEVDAQEGLSYLWTKEEIVAVLGAEDAKIFNRVYGVDRGPNFADPHHGTGRPDKNILFLPQPIEKTGADPQRLEQMRQKLYAVRAQRKQPLLDTKIITSWNALMIRALAYGGKVLQDQRFLDAAGRAADYLLRQHRLPDGGLYRASRDGQMKYNGFVDDYAFLIHAMLELRSATGQEQWREHAASLTMIMQDKFGDPSRGGFYFTEKNATDLIVRQKVGTDSPLPSGNAIAALALLELDQRDAARRTLEAFAGQLEQNSESMSAMLEAAILYVQRYGAFAVEPSAEGGEADRPMSPQQIAEGVVSLEAEWIRPTELKIEATVLKGFHINAHQAGKNLVATQLIIEGAADVEYPPGEETHVAFADEPIRLYTGKVAFIARFNTPPAANARIRLGLHYQACDENACLPPVTKQAVLSR